MKILFYDLKTTGINPEKSGIYELTAILVNMDINNVSSELTRFNLKINSLTLNKEYDNKILKANNITIEEIKQYKDSQIQFKEFCNILDKYCDRYNTVDKILLCGYNNLHFDNQFLRNWFIDNNNNYFGSYFWSNSIDVLSETSRYLFHYRPALKNFQLKTVAKTLNINFDNILNDEFFEIQLTMEIYLYLISKPLFKVWDEIEATNIYKNNYLK
jgi:DNA polymerase-3 subunit epsilon